MNRFRAPTWRGWAGILLGGVVLLAAAWWGWTVTRPWNRPPAPPDVAVPDGVAFQESIPYCTVAGQTLLLDMAQPVLRPTPRPAVLLIHGGAWMYGQRWDMRRLQMGLAQQGFVAVSVSYRLAPEHPFPAAIEDVKCAVRWLRTQAQAQAIDPQRIAAWGHSAGAHLAAILGSTAGQSAWEGRSGEVTDSRVQAVVAHGGPYELTAVADPEAAAGFSADARRGVQTFVGDITPAALRRASPVAYVSPQSAPTLILHGDQDAIVPVDQARRFDSALRAQGVPVQLMLLPGVGHAGFGPQPEAVWQQVLAFLAQSFRSP